MNSDLFPKTTINYPLDYPDTITQPDQAPFSEEKKPVEQALKGGSKQTKINSYKTKKQQSFAAQLNISGEQIQIEEKSLTRRYPPAIHKAGSQNVSVSAPRVDLKTIGQQSPVTLLYDYLFV